MIPTRQVRQVIGDAGFSVMGGMQDLLSDFLITARVFYHFDPAISDIRLVNYVTIAENALSVPILSSFVPVASRGC